VLWQFLMGYWQNRRPENARQGRNSVAAWLLNVQTY